MIPVVLKAIRAKIDSASHTPSKRPKDIFAIGEYRSRVFGLVIFGVTRICFEETSMAIVLIQCLELVVLLVI